MSFGQDQNGAYKTLDDGRVLRVEERIFGAAILTLSRSVSAQTWEDGW